MTARYGCPEEEIGHYTCYRANDPIYIDGRLDELSWEKAPKSPRFVDLVTGESAPLNTRMAALWDDVSLYIGFWVEEPRVQAKLTERDSPVYMENDVEVFIAGKDCYYEFEINALGAIYEVFFIWQDAFKKGSAFDMPEFDFQSQRVDVLGGFQDSMRFGKHPRGKRWAFLDWDFPGMRSAVHVDGTLNDNSDVDKGWTVELAFPWKGMELMSDGRSLPPKDGDTWRMDFSRFEAFDLNGNPIQPSAGWVFNKHGFYDSHIPECFTFVHFSTKTVNNL
ncbi:MAG: carbohydrate-binding family 9-like protein [Candidatus Aminicenantes bacterium]|nr:MAG: carbohydrate-binding family 9-like protein [Candidatus Aminicenantes bacterium]